MVKELLDSCDAQKFPSDTDTLCIFAKHLSENKLIYVHCKERKEDGAAGLIAILCDWYREELIDMDTATALERLVYVLEHPHINLRPLAAKINKISRSTTSGSKNSNWFLLRLSLYPGVFISINKPF